MADSPTWRVRYNDKDYIFDPRKHLTVEALTQIKAWYGIELGRYFAFQDAWISGDPQAALCVVWLVRKAAGEQKVPEPNDIPDFALADLYQEYIPPAKAKAADPTRESPSTSDSTETQTSSGTDISDSSQLSAISQPAT